MKEKTKQFLKKYLIGFILGVVSVGIVAVYAETYFPSNDVTYDNTESGLTSTNVQGAIDELYTECTKEPTAGETIIEDAGLEKDPYECRYFFTGANPNNYINFNNEIAQWRIISVECDGTIKIMRTSNIGNQYWDDEYYGSNNWNKPATLNTYLNNTYYNVLNSTAQSQITAKDWSIGAVTANNNDLADQINDESNTTWNGKIALLTVSEYIRTNSNKTSCGTYTMNNTNYSTCKNTTWIYMNSYSWMQSPLYNSTDQVFNINSTGRIYITTVMDSTSAVLPALYLSPNIKITGGTGTESDPYTIN